MFIIVYEGSGTLENPAFTKNKNKNENKYFLLLLKCLLSEHVVNKYFQNYKTLSFIYILVLSKDLKIRQIYYLSMI